MELRILTSKNNADVPSLPDETETAQRNCLLFQITSTMETNWNKSGSTDSRIQELTVLQSELSYLGKNARVFRQQRNSSIMFQVQESRCIE